MSQPQIYVTAADAKKLRDLLYSAQTTGYRGSEYVKLLSQELERAKIVSAHEIPPDVITMNSTVELVDTESNEQMEYTLVFPEKADVLQGKISVLAPIGTAMLGFRTGDTFAWDTPDGRRFLRVGKVLFQPQASGDFQ
jgi:regulator of nucleoside diphosphate kinase